MKPLVAWISLAALFTAGLAAGALGMHLFGARVHAIDPVHRIGHPPFGERMANRLDLTESQREQVAEILAEGRAGAEAIRDEYAPRLHAHMQQVHERIEEVLTREQREELERLFERHPRPVRFLLGEEPGPFGPHPGPRRPRRGH